MSTNLLLVALFVFCMIIMSLNLARRKKKVIFYGTNINELDVLSGGYIAWVTELMKEEGVEDDYQLTHSIRSGDKLNDLHARLNNNLLIKDAGIAIIYPGLNDLEEQITTGSSLNVEQYEATLQTIVDKIKAVNTKVILCTPLPIPAERRTEYHIAEIQSYVEAISTVAHHSDVSLVNLSGLLGKSPTVAQPQNINQLVAIEIWKVIKEMK